MKTPQSKQKVGTVYLIAFTADKSKKSHNLKCEAWLDYADKISRLEDVTQVEGALKDQFKEYDNFSIVSFTPLRDTFINGENKIYLRKI